MALDTENFNLFGLDLSRLPATFRAGWLEALEWSALRWLAPRQTVHLKRSLQNDLDYEVIDYRPSRVTGKQGGVVNGFVAVQAPEDIVLVREMTLPDLLPEQLQHALELEVGVHSPFGPDATVWGWRSKPISNRRIAVTLVMTKRQDVLRLLNAYPGATEVWAGPEQCPVVLRGFGEGMRIARETRSLRFSGVLWGGALILLLTLVFSPFLQLRQQVFDAQERYHVLQGMTVEAVAARAQLQLAQDQLAEVLKGISQRHSMPELLELLARELPDSAFVLRLVVDGETVRLFGQGSNTSTLVDRLGAVPGFREVRSISPILQVRGTSQEQFSVEFKYVPES